MQVPQDIVERLEYEISEQTPTVTAEKTPTPSSGDLHKGWDAYHRGDYVTALRELEPLAEHGNANAKYFIGLMYKRGHGVSKNVEIYDEFSQGQPIYLCADQVHLTQVLLNLLSNAVKYNNEGGSVTVQGYKTDDNCYRILISDTGIGIAANEQ